MRSTTRRCLWCGLAALWTACSAKEQATGPSGPANVYAGSWTSFDVRASLGAPLGLGGFTVAANGAFGFGATTQVAGFYNDGGAVAGAIVVGGQVPCNYSFSGTASSTTAAAGSVSVVSPFDTTLCLWRSFTTAR